MHKLARRRRNGTVPASLAAAAGTGRPVVEPVEPRVLFTTFLVTNTLDDAAAPPANSFRWAIQQANANPNGADPDEIHFNIPGTGTRTITPVAPLPPITETVIVDAATEQPGWVDSGTPDVEATPVVEISGASAGANADGLRINANDVTVRGLAINRFSRFGVSVTGNGALIIQSNVGTSPTPTAVDLSARPGLLARGNGSDGIRIAGDDNAVGNTVVAFNGGAGVAVVSGSGNDVGINPIFQNAGEDIDLGANGRTLNDVRINPTDPPSDSDTGPNGLLNYPVLTTPTSSNGTTTITGTVATLPNTELFISIFTNPTQERAGRTLLDTVFLNSAALGEHGIPTTDVNGNGMFTLSVPTSSVNGYVTAVAASFAPATALRFLDTSEYSDAVPAVSATVPHVSAVYVNGTGWNSGFRTFLQTQGFSDNPALGFQITSADQLRSIPWAAVNQVSIKFDTDVAVDQADLQVVTRTAPGTDATAATSAFTYDTTARVGTWTLASALPQLSKVLLNLDGDAGGGVTATASGRLLDGDWNNPTSPTAPAAPRPFPSGDGAAGGDFRFRFNMVGGDADRNGRVDAFDTLAVRAKQGSNTTTATANYSVLHDYDSNGRIDAFDTLGVRARQGTNINTVTGDPAGTTTSAVFGSDSIADALARDGVL